MHKFVLKYFNFLRNCLQFVKIFCFFCILMLLLYWIQNLAQYNWGWLGFITPVLDLFLDIATNFSQKSISLLGAVFEYKYGIALLIILGLYFLTHCLYLLLNKIEEFYCDSRDYVKKIQENQFNSSLEKKMIKEEKKLKYYQIHISTDIKKKVMNFDIDKHNIMMNKFLMEKLNVSPKKYMDGFLYSFSDFEHIDDVLEYFFKVINSDAPLKYYVCVQLLDNSEKEQKELFEKIINLKIENKIVMSANTAYRYDFNQSQKYEKTQIGVFQSGDKTFEVHQFICN